MLERLEHNKWLFFVISASVAGILTLCYFYQKYTLGASEERLNHVEERFEHTLNLADNTLQDFAASDSIQSMLFRFNVEKALQAPSSLKDFQDEYPYFTEVWVSDRSGKIVAGTHIRNRLVSNFPHFDSLRKGARTTAYIEQSGLTIAASVYDFNGRFRGAVGAVLNPAMVYPQLAADWLERIANADSGIALVTLAKDSVVVMPAGFLSGHARFRLLEKTKEANMRDGFVTEMELDGRQLGFISNGEARKFGGHFLYFHEPVSMLGSLLGLLLLASYILTGLTGLSLVYNRLRILLGSWQGADKIWLGEVLQNQEQKVQTLLKKTADVLDTFRNYQTQGYAFAGGAIESDRVRYEEAKDLNWQEPAGFQAPVKPTAPSDAETWDDVKRDTEAKEEELLKAKEQLEEARRGADTARKEAIEQAERVEQEALEIEQAAQERKEQAVREEEEAQAQARDAERVAEEAQQRAADAEAEAEREEERARQRLKERYERTQRRLNDEFITLHRQDREFIYLNPFESDDRHEEGVEDSQAEFVYEDVSHDEAFQYKEPFFFDRDAEPAEMDQVVEDSFAVQNQRNLSRERIFTDDLKDAIDAVRTHKEAPDSADEVETEESVEQKMVAVPSGWGRSEIKNIKDGILAAIDKFYIPDVEIRQELSRAYIERRRERGVVQDLLRVICDLVQADSSVYMYFNTGAGCYLAGLSHGLADREKSDLFFSQQEDLLVSDGFFRVIGIQDKMKSDEFFQKRFEPAMLERLSAVAVMNLRVFNERSSIMLFYYNKPDVDWGKREQIWSGAVRAYIHEYLPLLKSREQRYFSPAEVRNYNTRMFAYLQHASESYLKNMTVIKIQLGQYFEKSQLEASQITRYLENAVRRTITAKEFLIRMAPDRFIIILKETNEVNLMYLLDEVNEGFFEIQKRIDYFPDNGYNFYNYL